jgi:hypothetical protein
MFIGETLLRDTIKCFILKSATLFWLIAKYNTTVKRYTNTNHKIVPTVIFFAYFPSKLSHNMNLALTSTGSMCGDTRSCELVLEKTFTILQLC